MRLERGAGRILPESVEHGADAAAGVVRDVAGNLYCYRAGTILHNVAGRP
jgi:hypothetical protein